MVQSYSSNDSYQISNLTDHHMWRDQAELVESDMLLVSDYVYTLNKCQYNLKSGTCELIQYNGLHNMFIRSL